MGTTRSSPSGTKDGLLCCIMYDTVPLFSPEREFPIRMFLFHYRTSIIFLVSTRLSVCSR